jgi:hypothetical protein
VVSLPGRAPTRPPPRSARACGVLEGGKLARGRYAFLRRVGTNSTITAGAWRLPAVVCAEIARASAAERKCARKQRACLGEGALFRGATCSTCGVAPCGRRSSCTPALPLSATRAQPVDEVVSEDLAEVVRWSEPREGHKGLSSPGPHENNSRYASIRQGVAVEHALYDSRRAANAESGIAWSCAKAQSASRKSA